jgi:uncharacterized membrane protein (UPF0127 family)
MTALARWMYQKDSGSKLKSADGQQKIACGTSNAGRRVKISNLTRQSVLASHVEVADRGPKRRKGLLGRDGLSAEEGLWIFPCEAVHTVGMRFAIDLVYLDRNHRVKKICSNVPPFRLSACLSAHSVVELAAGAVSRTQTKPGDKLEFSPADPTVNQEQQIDGIHVIQNPSL